ncbi:MAG: glycosyltransferase family 2 protein [Gemmatimonadota bacterium]|jgi:glycosyltransferase involved in cell wall biosynthesis|nr:glycosyltransferase family 2 protein [Gemmatimonadota bacterium]
MSAARPTPVRPDVPAPAGAAAAPAAGPAEPPDVSVLVPAKDEAENLPEFLRQCAEAFAADPATRYEVVVVDDGSRDGSWALLGDLARQYAFLRTVRHRSQRGIAEALRSGWLASRGPILVFYPADLQFKPADIPRLVAPILAGDADMVTGQKQGVYEKAFVSGIYNRLSRVLFRVPVKDLNSVKAYRREVMSLVPTRPDWHRYLIVIAATEGYTVTEIPVTLYPRTAGKSKFGLSRIPIGVLDMLAVWFELRFGRKPLLLFGMLGAAMFAVGVLAGLGALVVLLATGVGVRAVWTVIQTSLVLGSIFFATGLLGEQIAGTRADLRELRRRVDDVAPGGE